MAVTATLSNHYKYQLAKKLIDLSADDIRVLLMRDGFVFDKDVHATRANIKATDTDTTYAINSSLELTDSGADFVDLGFVPGNSFTMSGFTTGGNNTTKIISTVAAGTIVFVDTAGLVEEVAGDSVTITSNDELATGFGYTADTKELTTKVLTEDDSENRSEMTCDDVSWDASGGNIGPTPGASLYDNSSTDKTIIGFLNFSGNQTTATGNTFALEDIAIRHS